MKSQQFQYTQYTPAEFEQFRNAVQLDGFSVTQNTIDTVSGHIGALVYLTGNYNRNQQVLTVTVKTSPWQTFQDSDLKANLLRVVSRDKTTGAPVNATPVKSAVTPAGTGATLPPKQAVTPAVTPKANPVATPEVAKVPEPLKVETPTPSATPAATPVPAQTPLPAQTPVPKAAEPAATPAPATPTESK
jgi:hypothetical protein